MFISFILLTASLPFALFSYSLLIKKSARDDYDLAERTGKPHSWVNKHTVDKLTKKNASTRVKEVLDGMDGTKPYSMEYLSDPNGFKIEGTFNALQVFGKDATPKDRSRRGFGDVKNELTKSHKDRENKSERMIFKVYDANSTNVPRDCVRSTMIRSGWTADMHGNHIYTYYFYNDDFHPEADTLKLPQYLKADSNDSDFDSDSD